MMMKKEYDVLGIGSPLLDIIIEVEEADLLSHGLKKGVMHLIDRAESESILKNLQAYEKQYISGGSAANTISGVSLLGGEGLFLGVIGNDSHGQTYEDEMRAGGAHTSLKRHPHEPTGRAITFITPDGERTFATCLGAAAHLGKQDISEADIRKSKILHIEGYLLDEKSSRAAVVSAMDLAKKSGTLVSLDLSAAWMIAKNFSVLRDLVKRYVDIVFVNEDEALAFTGKREREALQEISDLCDIAVVKLGARGSLVQKGEHVYVIDPYKAEVVNLNGAGDMYAAGFLQGIARGQGIEAAGKVGSFVASLVVASPGARMHKTHYKKLKDILKKEG